MSERTTTINNVQVTETQLRVALAALDDTYIQLTFARYTEDDELDMALEEAGYPNGAIQTRHEGNLAGKGLCLDKDFIWAIETDDMGELVLTCKEKA